MNFLSVCVALFLVGVVLMGVGTYMDYYDSRDCKEKGGTMIKTYEGHACVRLERL